MRYSSPRSQLNRIRNHWEIRRKKVSLKSTPLEIGIEPTNLCNSNCVMCNRRFSRKSENQLGGHLSWELLQKCIPFIRQAQRVCFSGFGEPGLHPDYFEMASFIKNHGCHIYCFSNGSLLQKSVLERLSAVSFDHVCVSLGGGHRELHHRIRGIDNFDDIISGLTYWKKQKDRGRFKKPSISFNIVAMNSVIADLERILNLAAELGIDSITMPGLSTQGESIRMESPWVKSEAAKAQFAIAGQLAQKLGIKFTCPELTERVGNCHNLFSYMFVTWDGKILSCPFERFIMGDLMQQEIKMIWNNDFYRKLRLKYFTSGIETVCHNCSAWNNCAEAFLNPGPNSRYEAITFPDFLDNPKGGI